MTLHEAIDRFLLWSRENVRHATWARDHCERIPPLIETVGPDRPVATITLADLEDHIAALRARGLAESTVWGHVKTLRAFLKRLVDWEVIAESPARRLKQPRQPEKRPDFLTEDELNALTAEARGTRFLVPVAIGALAGLRLGELIRLEWSDVDFERRLLHVRNKAQSVGKRAAKPRPRSHPDELTKSGRAVKVVSDDRKVLKTNKEVADLRKWVRKAPLRVDLEIVAVTVPA